MAAKKKPASAADLRMKEETDKKKMARTDAKGRSGMGASSERKKVSPQERLMGAALRTAKDPMGSSKKKK